MEDLMKQILAKPIELADHVIKSVDEASSLKQECVELKSKIEKLADLLCQATKARSDFYGRPTRCMIDDTEQVLNEALNRGSGG
ncbi:hypothetical protein LINPERHAP1_LOCUS28875 [Linum perenne]